MANYREFRRKARRRRMKRRLAAAGTVLAVVLIAAGLIWALGPFRGKKAAAESASAAASQSASAASGAASVSAAASSAAAAPDAAAATTFALTPNADANWNTSAYGVRVLDASILGQDDGTTAMDFRLAAQPAAGTADTSYFNSVTFLGDSVTQGLAIYDTGLPNAHYCAYRGAGPNTVVNGVTVKNVDGQEQIPMDALVASAPDRVYILMGTNVLVRLGNDAAFLAYYGQMLDMIKAALPNAAVYVQSITPVRPEVVNEKPGLYRERLMAINDELAALALQKGCTFLDLWEVLADDNGDLIAEYAQPDGIHLKPEGYTPWINYLLTHTVYTPGVAYAAGTSYYIEQ